MENEVWKDIPQYEGRYQVSNMGRVYSLITKKILAITPDGRGYLRVNLYKKPNKPQTEQVHRLVALAFLPNPDGLPEVNHKNEITTDNRLENLEWCNKKYNCNYGTRNDRISKALTGRSNTAASKVVLQLDLNGNVIAEYPSTREASRQTATCNSRICECCNGKARTAGGYKWMYKQEQKE